MRKLHFLHLLVFALLLLPLLYVIKSIMYNCQSVVDYSIYQQAINELATFKSWNPYVTVRDIFIFNEHFDPIIYTAIPIFILTDFSSYALAFHEWIWYFLSIAFIFVTVKPKTSYHIIFLILLTLFSRGVLSGLLYPGHPVTWALLPLTILTYGLVKDRFNIVLISTISLCFFKETFAFGLFGLSFGYLLDKDKRKFLFLFILSTFFIVFEMKLRAIIIGETLNYGNQFLGQIIADPLHKILDLFIQFNYKAFFKIMFPYILPVLILLKKEKLNVKTLLLSPVVRIILFLTPLAAIHFIINRFYFHHASKFSIVFIGLIAFSNIEYFLKPKKLYIALCFLFFLNGLSMYTKVSKALMTHKIGTCSRLDNTVKDETKIIKKMLKDIDEDKIIFSTGGIIPQIIKPKMKIYHKMFSKQKDVYDVLLLETSGATNTYPINLNDILKIKTNCKPFVDKILFSSENHFLALGKFPNSCIY